jgi:hypothetical protein
VWRRLLWHCSGTAGLGVQWPVQRGVLLSTRIIHGDGDSMRQRGVVRAAPKSLKHMRGKEGGESSAACNVPPSCSVWMMQPITPCLSLFLHRFCPAGSATPSAVQSGYYSTPESMAASLRSSQSLCEAGRYCVAGVRHLCSAGTWSAETGRSTPCTNLCIAGT